MASDLDTGVVAPCPFCGGAFLVGQEPHDNHPVAGMFYLYHDYGPLGSPARACPIEVQRHFDTREEAIAAWNRRTPPAPAAGWAEGIEAAAKVADEDAREADKAFRGFSALNAASYMLGRASSLPSRLRSLSPPPSPSAQPVGATFQQIETFREAYRKAREGRDYLPPLAYEVVGPALDAVISVLSPAAPVQGETPEGWRLVPEEPTADMREAGMDWLLSGADLYVREEQVVVETATPRDVYRVMLAAAPAAPTPPLPRNAEPVAWRFMDKLSVDAGSAAWVFVSRDPRKMFAADPDIVVEPLYAIPQPTGGGEAVALMARIHELAAAARDRRSTADGYPADLQEIVELTAPRPTLRALATESGE